MVFEHFRFMFCEFWIVRGVVRIRVLIKNDEWRMSSSASFVWLFGNLFFLLFLKMQFCRLLGFLTRNEVYNDI